MKSKIIFEIMTDITIVILLIINFLYLYRFHRIETSIEQLQDKVDYLAANNYYAVECTTSGGILVGSGCLYWDVYSK